jgi:hypothetical protein
VSDIVDAYAKWDAQNSTGQNSTGQTGPRSANNRRRAGR